MSISDLLETLGKEKRRQARAKESLRFATGMGIAALAGVTTGILIAPKSGKEIVNAMKDKTNSTVETLKNLMHKGSDTVKDAAADTAQKASDVINDAKEKTAGVEKEVKAGYKRIKKDIYKTKQGISRRIHESVK